MPIIHYIDIQGGRYEVEVPEGSSVMQGAIDGMIDGILGECGGQCRCGTCHCYVDGDWLEKIEKVDDIEAMMLEAVIDPRENSRLSCKIKVTKELDGLVIRVPERQY